MGIFRGVKNEVKRHADVKSWLDTSMHSQILSAMGELFKSLFVPATQVPIETFEQAQQRLNLTEVQIQARQNEFFRLAMIFIVFGLLATGYTLYLAMSGEVHGTFLSLCVTLLIFGVAFRYHFWFFQVKNRRLGCTFKMWYNGSLKGTLD